MVAYAVVDKRTNKIIRYDNETWTCEDCGNGVHRAAHKLGVNIAIFISFNEASSFIFNQTESHQTKDYKKRIQKEIKNWEIVEVQITKI